MGSPLAAISIHLDFDQYTRAHMGKLRLLEIGGYPDIIEGHDVYKLLSDTHVVAHLHASLADNARHGRTNLRIGEVQLRLRELSLSLQHLGVGCLRVGASQGNLFGRSLRSLQFAPSL